MVKSFPMLFLKYEKNIFHLVLLKANGFSN